MSIQDCLQLFKENKLCDLELIEKNVLGESDILPRLKHARSRELVGFSPYWHQHNHRL